MFIFYLLISLLDNRNKYINGTFLPLKNSQLQRAANLGKTLLYKDNSLNFAFKIFHYKISVFLSPPLPCFYLPRVCTSLLYYIHGLSLNVIYNTCSLLLFRVWKVKWNKLYVHIFLLSSHTDSHLQIYNLCGA